MQSALLSFRKKVCEKCKDKSCASGKGGGIYIQDSSQMLPCLLAHVYLELRRKKKASGSECPF
jgi:hypothetical protein